jgi:hypothetical protein
MIIVYYWYQSYQSVFGSLLVLIYDCKARILVLIPYLDFFILSIYYFTRLF